MYTLHQFSFSCYTANLAAFLTINKFENEITSVEDLLKSNKKMISAAAHKTALKVILKYKLSDYLN